MHVCSRMDNFEGIQILLKHGADTDQQDRQGQTPLIVAVKSDCVKAVRELCKNGANSSLLDLNLEGPIHIGEYIFM